MDGGDGNVGLLTNAEVADLLASQMGSRQRAGAGRSAVTLGENNAKKLPQVDFIEKSVSKYMTTHTSKGMDLASITEIRRLILAENLGLTEAELLQLLNHSPKYVVEVHMLIEECAERLSEEQVERVIEIIASKVPSSN